MMWARWSGTFDKLLVFSLTEYDKLVFIDSDMMVLGNLDGLFDCPHMSACCDGLYDKVNLNSGLMVIEPTDDEDQMKRMLELTDVLSQDKQARGDQDVIRALYPEWSKDERLHLPVSYNTFIDEAARNCSKLGYDIDAGGEKSVRVVHFIGPDKPWFQGKALKWKIYNFVYRRKMRAKGRKEHKNNIVTRIFRKYDFFLKSVNKKLRDVGVEIYELN